VKGWNWYVNFLYFSDCLYCWKPRYVLVSRVRHMHFVLLNRVPEFFNYFDNFKRTDQGVLSGWRMLSTPLECWFQSSNSSMTLATSGPVVAHLLSSLNQLLYHLLWCRHSCAWSIGIYVKTFVFCTLKQSSLNILNIEYLWIPSTKFNHALQMQVGIHLAYSVNGSWHRIIWPSL
jgi:hypothetical protein